MPEVAVFGLPENPAGEIAIRSAAPIRKLVERCDVVVAGPAMSEVKSAARLTRHLLRSCSAQIVLDAAILMGLAEFAKDLRAMSWPGSLPGCARAGPLHLMRCCGLSGCMARPVGAVPNRSAPSAFSRASYLPTCPVSCAACER